MSGGVFAVDRGIWRGGMKFRPVAVYCIAEIANKSPLIFNRYKIGVASNVRARLAQLQTGNPRKLSPIIVYWYRSRAEATAAERAVHVYLQEHTLSGEWFTFEGCPFEAMECAPAASAYTRSVDFYYRYDDDGVVHLEEEPCA